MDDVHLILNPNAGSAGQGEDVRVWCARNGVTVHETQAAGDGRRIACEVVEAGATGVLAAGGDGTISEIIDGIANATDGFERTKFGIVPLGTGNDLARSIGLEPEAGPLAALAVAAHGRQMRADVMRVTTDEGAYHLLNSLSGGFAVRMAEYMDGDMKKWLGAASYPIAALRTMADVPWFDCVVEADGERIETETAAVIVCNGRFAAGGQEIAPTAALDDGLANLLIVTAETIAERAEVLLSYLAKTHTDSPHIITRHARRVSVRCDPAMKFSGDGEPIGCTPLTCELLPGVLRLVVP